MQGKILLFQQSSPRNHELLGIESIKVMNLKGTEKKSFVFSPYRQKYKLHFVVKNTLQDSCQKSELSIYVGSAEENPICSIDSFNRWTSCINLTF